MSTARALPLLIRAVPERLRGAVAIGCWNAQASLALESLNLSDGDIVVYRAIARDSNPGGSPVQSEQYLIEIGRTAQIADAGFSLPMEEKKYAISQQMVIYKTEQLLKSRPRIRQVLFHRNLVVDCFFCGRDSAEDQRRVVLRIEPTTPAMRAQPLYIAISWPIGSSLAKKRSASLASIRQTSGLPAVSESARFRPRNKGMRSV